jgi:Ner family transcriptional regulator
MLISKAIGVPAESIWPSRYFDAKTCERVARPLRAHRMKRREDISRV